MERRIIHTYLNELKSNANLIRCEDYDKLKDKLETTFIKGESYLEFILKKNFFSIFDSWRESNRSQVIFKDMSFGNHNLTLNFESNSKKGGIKYLNCEYKIAFLENFGFYIAEGNILKNGLDIDKETIYLKENFYNKLN